MTQVQIVSWFVLGILGLVLCLVSSGTYYSLLVETTRAAYDDDYRNTKRRVLYLKVQFGIGFLLLLPVLLYIYIFAWMG